MEAKKVKVTLLRSPHHRIPKHRATLRALGLRKIGAVREHTMTPAVAGMVKSIDFMIRVEELS